MSETETDALEKKPKISRLALWAVVLSILAIIFGLTRFFCIGGLLQLAAFIIAIVSVALIMSSKRELSGYSLCILVIVGLVSLWTYGFYATYRRGGEIHTIKCGFTLVTLKQALDVYSRENNGQYPTMDKWCDLIIEETDVISKPLQFSCFGGAMDAGPSHYAINPNVEPNSPNDVVLLFETKGGWNQFGGPEILTFENHRGKGCNILFNDGTVHFVEKERLGELKW